jgi:hypothetical protein
MRFIPLVFPIVFTASVGALPTLPSTSSDSNVPSPVAIDQLIQQDYVVIDSPQAPITHSVEIDEDEYVLVAKDSLPPTQSLVAPKASWYKKVYNRVLCCLSDTAEPDYEFQGDCDAASCTTEVTDVFMDNLEQEEEHETPNVTDETQVDTPTELECGTLVTVYSAVSDPITLDMLQGSTLTPTPEDKQEAQSEVTTEATRESQSEPVEAETASLLTEEEQTILRDQIKGVISAVLENEIVNANESG